MQAGAAWCTVYVMFVQWARSHGLQFDILEYPTVRWALYAVNPFVAESRKSSAVAGPAFSRL